MSVRSGVCSSTFFLLLAAVLVAPTLDAQLVVTLGNQTSMSNSFPFNGTSFRFQAAYAPVDLGIPAGAEIRELRVFGTATTVGTYNGMRVRLGHGTLPVNSMTTTFDTNWIAASVVTCLGPVNHTPGTVPGVGGNWYTFPLTTPFIYNGSDNIVVDWSYDSRLGNGFSVATAAPVSPPEQPRQRIYSSGGNWLTATGTAGASAGHYGIQFHYVPPFPAVTMQNTSPPLQVMPNAAIDQVLMKLRANAFNAAQSLNSITFTKTGSAANAAFSSVKLVRDNNDDGLVDAGDTTLGSGPLTVSGAITFSGAPLQPVSTSAAVPLLLAGTYAGPLPFGTTLNFEVTSSANISWSGGTDLTVFPIQSGLREVQPPSVQFGTATNNNTIPFNGVGYRFQAAWAASELSMAPNTPITELRVNGTIPAGPSPAFGNMRVRIGHTNIAVNALTTTFDTNYQGALTACLGPVDLTPETIPGGGGQWYVFKLTTPFIYDGVNNMLVDFSYDARLGVTAFNVNTAAATGELVRSRVYLSGGNYLSATGTAVANLGNLGIQFFYLSAPAGVAAGSSLSNVPPPILAAGADRVVTDIRVFAAAANRNVNSMKFTKSGTFPDALITQVKLVRDNNDDGLVNAGDTTLGTGTLTAGAVTFSGAPLQIVTQVAPVRLLVAITNASAAPFGSTIALSVMSAADFVIASGAHYTWFPLSSGLRTVEAPGVVMGNPTAPNNSIPFNATQYRFQTAYTAAELNIPAGSSISEVLVHGSIIDPVPSFSGLQCLMAYTALTPDTLTGTFDSNYTLPLVTCLGPATVQPERIPYGNAYYYRFQLTTPFEYNGTGNLLVEWIYTSKVGTGFNIATAIPPANWKVELPRHRIYSATATALTGTIGTAAGSYHVKFRYLDGPILRGTPVAGAAQQLPATSTGVGGTGIQAGRFTVSSGSLPGATLAAIGVGALGTGNDSNAYTEVALYRDANGNNLFDPLLDTLIGTPAPNFGTDDGEVTFNLPGAEQAFGISETRTYLIVVKLNGPALAVNLQTFNYEIRGLTPGPGSYGIAAPTPVMLGIVISGPQLAVVAIAAAPQAVPATDQGAGNNGIPIGRFSVTNNNQGASQLNSITIKAAGTGNDQFAYSEVALYVDNNANTTWEFGTDLLYGTAATAYPADNGTLTFTQVKAFAISESAEFYVVVKLNGTQLAVDAETFNTTVLTLSVGAGVAFVGTESPVMTGLVVSGARLTVAPNTTAAAQTVLANAAPASGLLGGGFTVTNSALAAATLNSITVEAQGTGDDVAAYTEVRLYRDVNDNQLFDSGTDTPYGATFANFGADNGARTFSLAVPFTVSEVVRFLIVVKFNGPTLAVNAQAFNYRVSDIAVSAGVAKTNNNATMNGFVINGPVVTALVTAGAAQPVLANAQGAGNNGINAGTFVLTNLNLGTSAVVSSVTITSTGTGNGQTAYSSVQLYEDTNANTTWDFGAGDTLIGTVATFNASNQATFTLAAAQGTLNSAAAISFKQFFIVVKLNGATIAPVGNTFNFQLTGAVILPNAIPSGIPNAATMLGLVISPPSFAFADGAAPQVTAYRTLGSYLLQKFTATYPAGSANSLTSITIGASGSGNDLLGYSSVRLYLDAVGGTPGDFDAGDTLIDTQGSFSNDNGTAVFSISGTNGDFVAAGTKTFFVVGDFNGTPANSATFTTRVHTATTGYTGTTFNPVLPMAGYSAGAVIVLPPFVFADNSGQVITNAFLGDPGFTLQKFTVEYPSGPANMLGSISIAASGSGDDSVAYSGLHLYLDDPFGPTPGDLDALDTLVDSQAPFAADNGTLVFNVTGPASLYAPAEIKQFFVVADFNQAGINSTTFASTVTDGTQTNFGSSANGLPLGPSAGLNLLDANLRATFNGPGSATSVNCDDQGVNGDGLLLCDVSLATGPGSGWAISQLTFVATGTGNHATAYSDLWLYEDDGNGIWDGPALDSPAGAPSTAFNVGTNDVTFDLLNPNTGLNHARRFFLRARLAGTAVSGQTLNARLDSVIGTPLVGGSVRGTPLPNSTALIITTTTVTVLSGPATTADLIRKAGTAFVHPILNVRLGATNNDVTVNSITFSNAGTGNFVGDLATIDGFQVWKDDGDLAFTGADALLYQNAGASAVTATFAPAVTVPNSGTVDLWVVLNVLAAAATGQAVPVTDQSLFNTPADVSAWGGATVLLGTPAPHSNRLRLVDFFVSDFDPVADLPTGGKDITITGSGFMAPVIVKIDGVLCPGAAVINGGTMVTGIQVPQGSGLDMPITVKSGLLAEETLTQTFDYVPLVVPKPEGDSQCVATGSASVWPIVMALMALVPAAVRLRRRVAG